MSAAEFVTHESGERQKYYFDLGDGWYVTPGWYRKNKEDKVSEIRVNVRVYTDVPWGLKATKEGVSLTMGAWNGFKSYGEHCKTAFESMKGPSRSPALETPDAGASAIHLVVEKREGYTTYNFVVMRQMVSGKYDVVMTLASLKEPQFQKLLGHVERVDNGIEELRSRTFYRPEASGDAGALTEAEAIKRERGFWSIRMAILRAIEYDGDAAEDSVATGIAQGLAEMSIGAVHENLHTFYERTLREADLSMNDVSQYLGRCRSDRGQMELVKELYKALDEGSIVLKKKERASKRVKGN